MSIQQYFAQVQAEMNCPISKTLMNDPVITIDGHTYEKSSLNHWFDTSMGMKSPVTNLPLESKQMIPNIAFRNLQTRVLKIFPEVQMKIRNLTNLLKDRQGLIDQLNLKILEQSLQKEFFDEKSGRSKKQMKLQKMKQKNQQNRSKEISQLNVQIERLLQRTTQLQQSQSYANEKLCQLQIKNQKQVTQLRQQIKQLITGHWYEIKEAREQTQKEKQRSRKQLQKNSLQYAKEFKELGTYYFQNKRYQAALQIFKKCEAIYIAQNSNDSQEMSFFNLKMGQIYQNQQKYQEALLSYNWILSKHFNKPWSIEKAFILSKCGKVNEMRGNLSGALYYYEESLLNYQILIGRNSVECAATLNNLGRIKQQINNGIQQAFKHFSESIDIYQKSNQNQSLEASEPYHNLSLIYFSLQDQQKGAEMINSAIRIRQKLLGIDDQITKMSIQVKSYYLQSSDNKIE